jgi:hypothetical protein
VVELIHYLGRVYIEGLCHSGKLLINRRGRRERRKLRESEKKNKAICLGVLGGLGG